MAKPKAKSPEEKQAELERMLSMAQTTNHLAKPGTPSPPAEPASERAASPAPETPPGNQEQKGENVSVAPAAPESIPALAPAAPAPAPVAKPVPEPAPVIPPALVATVPNEETVPETEYSSETVPESTSAVEVGALDLASLFIPSTDKKVFTMRLTNAHYQYLLLLGTIVGNGASPPDIVHNVLAQFIDRNDAQIQKAITKQLRQRQSKK